MKKLKIIFMGTPVCACPFLEYLIKSEDVIGVFTAPDEPAGRHMKMKISPIKELALNNAKEVIQTHDLSEEAIVNRVKELNPDLIVVIAYGYKLPHRILAIPKKGSINIHFSLLPKYRGAAPVNWVIVNGEEKTGVTSFFLTDKMDAGEMISQEEVIIEHNDNAKTLMDKLVDKGVCLLNKTLQFFHDGKEIETVTQDIKKITTARKLKKIDGKIGWNNSNIEIRNKMRAFYPWPGSYSFVKDKDKELMIKLFDSALGDDIKEGKPGEVLDINKEKGMLIRCGRGTLYVEAVQLSGHKKMSAYQLSVGRKIKTGDILT